MYWGVYVAAIIYVLTVGISIYLARRRGGGR